MIRSLIRSFEVKIMNLKKPKARAKYTFHVQHVNTSLRKQSISTIGVQIRNRLNEVFKYKTSDAAFKLYSQQHLIQGHTIDLLGKIPVRLERFARKSSR